jgi:hypothetical protein
MNGSTETRARIQVATLMPVVDARSAIYYSARTFAKNCMAIALQSLRKNNASDSNAVDPRINALFLCA